MGKATQTLMALAGLMVLSQGTSQATEYPYCLSYAEGWAGMIERCDYSTMAQCQASAGGLNGSCAANWRMAWYQNHNPAVTEPGAPRKRIRR